MQPIIKGKDGVIRFKQNAIVDWLFMTGKIDLNEIAATPFPRNDREQFWQLLGYSVSGYGDLSFISRKTVKEADAIAEKLATIRRKKR